MNSIKDICQYIQKTVNENIAAGNIVSMAWLTTDILSQFSDINGNDADFYKICARHYVADQVKRMIDKFSSSTPDPQLTMDGFKYLQSAYTVKRNGERVIVPTPKVTYAEWQERIEELKETISGCTVHIREIEEYMEASALAGEAAL